jgi:hypothetical protein
MLALLFLPILIACQQIDPDEIKNTPILPSKNADHSKSSPPKMFSNFRWPDTGVIRLKNKSPEKNRDLEKFLELSNKALPNLNTEILSGSQRVDINSYPATEAIFKGISQEYEHNDDIAELSLSIVEDLTKEADLPWGSKIALLRMLSSPASDINHIKDVLRRQEIIQYFIENPDQAKNVLEVFGKWAQKSEAVFTVFLKSFFGGDELNLESLFDSVKSSNEFNLSPSRDPKNLFKLERRQNVQNVFKFLVDVLVRTVFTKQAISWLKGASSVTKEEVSKVINPEPVAGFFERNFNQAMSFLLPEEAQKRCVSVFHRVVDPLMREDLFALLGVLSYKYYFSGDVEENLATVIESIAWLIGAFYSIDLPDGVVTNHLDMFRKEMEMHKNEFLEVQKNGLKKQHPILRKYGFPPHFVGLVSVLNLKKPNQAIEDMYVRLSELSALAYLASILTYSKYPWSSVSSWSDSNKIVFEKLWNPGLVHQKGVVTQDVEVENILTLYAPNASGKTTYANSQLSALILAQSIGFVPARSSKLPFFNVFFTNRPPRSDLTDGTSQFKFEMKQLVRFLDSVQKVAYQNQQKMFFILDESVVQTRPFYAALLEVFLLKVLTLTNRCVGTLITHHSETLAVEHPKISYGQMSFSLIRDEKGIPIDVKRHYLFETMPNEQRKHLLSELPLSQRFIEEGFIREVLASLPEAAQWLEDVAHQNALMIKNR